MMTGSVFSYIIGFLHFFLPSLSKFARSINIKQNDSTRIPE